MSSTYSFAMSEWEIDMLDYIGTREVFGTEDCQVQLVARELFVSGA